ncbi:hypothetical protein P3T76_000475 [Phytophthora citrophthora]|uniref:Uncharacterized protein n=1 Tax=Phytophthora citrophthora TaxID=4793 RepID=A0AAD9LSD7_9STRA|nr:hypothetical protein P3T76_000475 [Phytophthora citrophthora]
MGELNAVLDLNTKYFEFRNGFRPRKEFDGVGEMSLHHYTKSMMPWLLHALTSSNSNSSKRKRAKESLILLRDAFLCTWDLDPTAARAVSDIDRSLRDDMWKEMEYVKCQKPFCVCFWEGQASEDNPVC